MCDQMGHSRWCKSRSNVWMAVCSFFHWLWIRWDANWLGLQPGVHKQEAMKGFDMQWWMAQSGQANVWLQTAVFYILQYVVFLLHNKQNKMWETVTSKRKWTCCVWTQKGAYLVFEAVYRDHIHHYDIIGKRLEPRQRDAAVWKHPPERKHTKSVSK